MKMTFMFVVKTSIMYKIIQQCSFCKIQFDSFGFYFNIQFCLILD